MDDSYSVDLDALTFDEWVNCIFGKPVGREFRKWSEVTRFKFTSEIQIECCTRLFTDPAFLLKKFSPEQIQQGLSLIDPVALCLSHMVWNESISFELRKRCLLSMVTLYKELFSQNLIGHQSVMWWDGMILWEEDRPVNADSRKVRDVIFQALKEILAMNNESCWGGALHGLGHLKHEKGPALIDQWLRSGVCRDPEMRKYAETCKTGDIM